MHPAGANRKCVRGRFRVVHVHVRAPPFRDAGRARVQVRAQVNASRS